MSVDVLICNLTRLGDLLQSQPLINDLHANGYTVGLLCQENFTQALPFLRNLQQTWTMPGAKFLSSLDKSWPLAFSQAMIFAQKVFQEAKPKYVINLTPTLSARLLARLVGQDAKLLGFGIDEFGYGINSGVWSSFISASATHRSNAPFNVADMLRRVALPLIGKGKGDFYLRSPDAEALAWADSFTAELAQKTSAFIAFQPGASSELRRWPIEAFRQLGQSLWDKAKIVPILLGSPNEIKLAEEYAKDAKHPWLNAIGKTNMPQVGALLKKCRLLVSNDTGTMHLASGLDVPILAFFLATAQPWDTAPLRPGSCCLEPKLDCHPCSFNKVCNHMNCRRTISAEVVEDLIFAWLETANWSSGITDRTNRECRVWLTGQDEENLAYLKLLSAGKEEERNLWLAQQREFWRHFLDSLSNPASENISTKRISLAVPKKISQKIIPTLKQTKQILDSIAACGEMVKKSPQARKLLIKNCTRLQGLLDSETALNALAAFWHEFSVHQGGDLSIFLPAVRQMSISVENFTQALSQAN